MELILVSQEATGKVYRNLTLLHLEDKGLAGVGDLAADHVLVYVQVGQAAVIGEAGRCNVDR